MGVVREAVDTETGVRVALKRLKKVEAEAIARFKNEFRALADVEHPNLVSLYELFVEEDDLFISMELVDGISFLDWVRPGDAARSKQRPAPAQPTATLSTVMSTSELLSNPEPFVPDIGLSLGTLPDLSRLRAAALQLAQGVSAIHGNGMLHRDLKSSNVLVTPEGRVVLLDFGVITELDPSIRTDQGRIIGTPSYMSPEQAAGQELSPAADWYSVGVMLYLALCGDLPFKGDTNHVIAAKQVRPAPPIDKRVEGAPEDLAALCMELLEMDPQRRPPGSDVLRRLGAPEPARSVVSLSSEQTAGFVLGRSAELEVLDRAFEDSRMQSVLVSVRGTSGMGKSALVRSFLDAARGDPDYPALTLSGRCYERESVDFKAFDPIIDVLSSYLVNLSELELEGLTPRDAPALAKIFPVLGRLEPFRSSRRRSAQNVDGTELRRRAFGALRFLLASLADSRPVIISVDDAQWADVDSAQLLAELMRAPDAPRMLVVLGFRAEDEEGSEFIQTFRSLSQRGSIAVREVDVGPLERDDAVQLALVSLGDAANAYRKALKIAEESGGSPLFIEELSRYAQEVTSEAELASLSLEVVLARRLERLPADSARLLELVAVAGRQIPQALVTRALGNEDPSLMAVLRAGSFVRSSTVRDRRVVECYHDRIRSAVVDGLDSEALRSRHRAIVGAVERQASPDPELLATHYHGAGELELAAENAARAAARAEEALAFDRAARLYQSALDWGQGRDAAARTALRVSMADCFAKAGRGEAAAAAYSQAARDSAGTRRLELQQKASRELFRSGKIDEGLEEVRDVLDSVGLRLADSTAASLAHLLWARARLRFRGLSYKPRAADEASPQGRYRVDAITTVAEGLAFVDPIRAATFQTLEVIEALNLGEETRIARALTAEVVFLSLEGPKNQARTSRILGMIRDIRDSHGTPDLRAVYKAAVGMTAFQEGRFQECYDRCGEALEIYRNECFGASFEIALCNTFICFALPFIDGYGLVGERCEAILHEARERGDLFSDVNLRVTAGIYGHLHKDVPEAAYADIDDALRRWSPRGFQLQHYNAMIGRIQVDVYRRDWAAARARLKTDWPRYARSTLPRVQILRVSANAIRGRVLLANAEHVSDASERRRLLAEVEGLGKKLEREPVAGYALAMGQSLVAGVMYMRGDKLAGLRKLEQAEALYRASGVDTWARASRVALEGARGNRDAVEQEYDRLRKGGARRPQALYYGLVPGFGIPD